MDARSEPTPFDQRLFVIFIATFAAMTVFEFPGQYLYPYPPDWRSNLITSLFTSGLAVIIAYFPLKAYYDMNTQPPLRWRDAMVWRCNCGSKRSA